MYIKKLVQDEDINTTYHTVTSVVMDWANGIVIANVAGRQERDGDIIRTRCIELPRMPMTLEEAHQMAMKIPPYEGGELHD